MPITATGAPSPDPGRVPVRTFPPFSVFDPVHLAQDDYGAPVYVAWPQDHPAPTATNDDAAN